MSTIDTQLNWGASYLTHDLYQRFIEPNASQARLVLVARMSVVVLALLGALATLQMDSVAEAWKFLATITAGSGLILLLRWLWWRINAWSEISVMTASLVGANLVDQLSTLTFPFSLVAVVAIALPVSLLVTFATKPEELETLAQFYHRVRPAGAWGPVAEHTGLPNRRLGWKPWLDVAMASAGIYAAIAGTGWLLFERPIMGACSWLVAVFLLALSIRSASNSPVQVEKNSTLSDVP